VQESVAQGLGFGLGEVTVQAKQAQPGQQIGGDSPISRPERAAHQGEKD
jgi:hypothetical protein